MPASDIERDRVTASAVMGLSQKPCINLRPYQISAIDAARRHVSEGRRRIILCLPTGGGKSVVMAAIIQSARRNFDARVVVIAHRVELIDQAVAHLARWGVTEVGVMRGDDDRTNPLFPVQVCTIQTLSRRNAPLADIVFVDECHRSMGASYLKVLRENYPQATVFGLTATPCRSDGKPLGDLFDAIEPVAKYSELIRDGFIVAPRCFGTIHAPDLSRVKTVAGDYELQGLEDAMSSSEILGDTLSEYRERAEGRRTLIFACTVMHSMAIASKFEAAGIRVAHVDANTPEDERRVVGEKLRTGEIEVCTNVGIYCEGADLPWVKCAIMARPTKSLGLYMQIAGRILRPWNEHTPASRSWLPEDGPSLVPIFLDQSSSIDTHGSPHADRKWSLTTAAETTEKKPACCVKCRAYIRHYPCPECGYAPPVAPREVVENLGAKLGERAFVDPMRAVFDRSLKEAQKKGFRPGYASFKVREQCLNNAGWPPYAWKQEADRLFAKDLDWQQRVEERGLDRARWAKPAVAVAVDPPAEDFFGDDDIPF